MELRVNDLLKINIDEDIIGDFHSSPWVYKALEVAPYVVVRRAPIINNIVPVGIRGNNRSQRQAAKVLFNNSIEIVTPEALATKKKWRTNKHLEETKMLKTLEKVESTLKNYNLVWGPTGSVGFELASGIETVTCNSDLDIIIRAQNILPINIAEEIIKQLSNLPINIDIQLEIPKGSIALAECTKNNIKIVLRTISGPKLMKNPLLEYLEE